MKQEKQKLTKNKLEITLELPVSLNHIYTTNQFTYQRVLNSQGRKWMDDCIWLLKDKIISLREITCSFNRVKIDIKFYFPDERRRDLDNYLKLTHDILVKSSLIKDDNWRIIKEERLRGFLDRKNPRMEMIITEID
jgi:Holliday junction resolvase RusA-like endonuclease